MSNGRADPFDIDLSGFSPRVPDKPVAATVRQVSEDNAFPSRAPANKTAEVASPPRRRRTGRNVQLNVKATAEVIVRFTALSDANGWAFGETLEHAVTALERELAAKSAS